jgi:TRAP-type C4-dicarboxylate transport system permease large subunit
MNVGGSSRRIVDLALAVVGHGKGGLGDVTILAGCVLSALSALSGSAVANAAALTALLLPMVVAAGHDKARAGGLIAATGVIGPVIPPSIGLVILGVAAKVSTSRLFLAAIVPGLLIGGVLFIINNAIGLVTPLVDALLNVVAGVGRLSIDDVTRGVVPCMLAELAIMCVMVLFPWLVTGPARWLGG